MYILIDEIVTLSIEIKFVLYIIELGTNKCFNNFDWWTVIFKDSIKLDNFYSITRVSS